MKKISGFEIFAYFSISTVGVLKLETGDGEFSKLISLSFDDGHRLDVRIWRPAGGVLFC